MSCSVFPPYLNGIAKRRGVSTCKHSNYDIFAYAKGTVATVGTCFIHVPFIGGGGATFGKFSGTFDGQGHTVSNLSLNIESHNSSIEGLGFFFRLDKATITDLRIDHFNIISQSVFTQTGGIVAALSSNSHFSNIYVSNSKILVSGHSGGLVGWDIHSDFNKCVADNTEARTSNDDWGVGGLVGLSQGATITNCVSGGRGI